MATGEIIERKLPGPARIVDAPGQKYEKYLPEHLAEMYEESIDDPQLLHLHREIALLDMRIKELAMRLDRRAMTENDIANEIKTEFGDRLPKGLANEISEFIMSFLPDGYIDNQTFFRLSRLVQKYENALASREILKADGALRLLFRVIRDQIRAGEVWDDLQKVMDTRKQLTAIEQKHMIETSQLISVEKAVIVLAATIDALREAVFKYVDDGEIRRHLLADAERRYASIFGTGEPPRSNRDTLDEESSRR